MQSITPNYTVQHFPHTEHLCKDTIISLSKCIQHHNFVEGHIMTLLQITLVVLKMKSE